MIAKMQDVCLAKYIQKIKFVIDTKHFLYIEKNLTFMYKTLYHIDVENVFNIVRLFGMIYLYTNLKYLIFAKNSHLDIYCTLIY
jgi:hypothetical protein